MKMFKMLSVILFVMFLCSSLMIGTIYADGNKFEISYLSAATTSPEPTTMLLSGLGLMGMGFYLRKKKNEKEYI